MKKFLIVDAIAMFVYGEARRVGGVADSFAKRGRDLSKFSNLDCHPTPAFVSHGYTLNLWDVCPSWLLDIVCTYWRNLSV